MSLEKPYGVHAVARLPQYKKTDRSLFLVWILLSIRSLPRLSLSAPFVFLFTSSSGPGLREKKKKKKKEGTLQSIAVRDLSARRELHLTRAKKRRDASLTLLCLQWQATSCRRGTYFSKFYRSLVREHAASEFHRRVASRRVAGILHNTVIPVVYIYPRRLGVLKSGISLTSRARTANQPVLGALIISDGEANVGIDFSLRSAEGLGRLLLGTFPDTFLLRHARRAPVGSVGGDINTRSARSAARVPSGAVSTDFLRVSSALRGRSFPRDQVSKTGGERKREQHARRHGGLTAAFLSSPVSRGGGVGVGVVGGGGSGGISTGWAQCNVQLVVPYNTTRDGQWVRRGCLAAGRRCCSSTCRPQRAALRRDAPRRDATRRRSRRPAPSPPSGVERQARGRIYARGPGRR